MGLSWKILVGITKTSIQTQIGFLYNVGFHVEEEKYISIVNHICFEFLAESSPMFYAFTAPRKKAKTEISGLSEEACSQEPMDISDTPQVRLMYLPGVRIFNIKLDRVH